MNCRLLCGENDCLISAPTEICLRVSQGSDTAFECSLTNEQGDPINISLDTVTFTAWDYIGGTQQFVKSNGPGTHSDPADGHTAFAILNSDYPDTADMLDWVYEVKRIQPGGQEAIHIEGKLIASPAGA